MKRQQQSSKRGQMILYMLLLAIVVACMVALSMCDKPVEAPGERPSGGDTLDIAIEYSPVTYYTYDENDEVVEVKDVNWFNNEESNPRVTKFKIIERDSHGNWTKRDIGSGVISTRQITYYE